MPHVTMPSITVRIEREDIMPSDAIGVTIAPYRSLTTQP